MPTAGSEEDRPRKQKNEAGKSARVRASQTMGELLAVARSGSGDDADADVTGRAAPTRLKPTAAAELLWRLAAALARQRHQRPRELAAVRGDGAVRLAVRDLEAGAAQLGPLWTGRALWALHVLACRPSDAFYEACVAQAWRDLPGMPLEHVAYLLWGFAAQQLELPDAFLAALLEAVLARLEEAAEAAAEDGGRAEGGEAGGAGPEGEAGVTRPGVATPTGSTRKHLRRVLHELAQLDQVAAGGGREVRRPSRRALGALLGAAPSADAVLFLLRQFGPTMGAPAFAAAVGVLRARVEGARGGFRRFRKRQGRGGECRRCLEGVLRGLAQEQGAAGEGLGGLPTAALVALVEDLAFLGMPCGLGDLERELRVRGRRAAAGTAGGVEGGFTGAGAGPSGGTGSTGALTPPQAVRTLGAFACLGHRPAAESLADWQFQIVTEVGALAPAEALDALWAFSKVGELQAGDPGTRAGPSRGARDFAEMPATRAQLARLRPEALAGDPARVAKYLWHLEALREGEGGDGGAAAGLELPAACLDGLKVRNLPAPLAVDLYAALVTLGLARDAQRLGVLESTGLNEFPALPPPAQLRFFATYTSRGAPLPPLLAAVEAGDLGRYSMGQLGAFLRALHDCHQRPPEEDGFLAAAVRHAGRRLDGVDAPTLVELCYHALALGADLGAEGDGGEGGGQAEEPHHHPFRTALAAADLADAPLAAPQRMMALYAHAMLSLPAPRPGYFERLATDLAAPPTFRLAVHAVCSCVVLRLAVPDGLLAAITGERVEAEMAGPDWQAEHLILVSAACALYKDGDAALLARLGPSLPATGRALSNKGLSQLLECLDDAGYCPEAFAALPGEDVQRMLRNCRSASAVMYVVDACSATTPRASAVFALQQLVSLGAHEALSQDPRLPALSYLVGKHVPAASVQELIKVLHSCVLLRFEPRDYPLATIRILLENSLVSEAVSPQAAVKLLWAYAKLSHQPGPPVLRLALPALGEGAGLAEAEEGAGEASKLPRAGAFSASEAANALWALAELGVERPAGPPGAEGGAPLGGPATAASDGLLAALEACFVARLPDATVDQVAAFLASCVALRHTPSRKTLVRCRGHIRRNLKWVGAEAGATVIWGFTQFRFVDEHLAAALKGAVARDLQALRPATLANFVWALSQFRPQAAPGTLEQLAEYHRRGAGVSWTGRDLGVVVWAFVAEGRAPPQALAEQLAEELGFASAERGLWSLQDVGVEGLAYALAAYARLDPAIGRELLVAVQGRADEVRGASPQALLNLLEAHALLDCSLNPAFGAALVAAVDAGAADFSARQLVQVLVGLAELRVAVDGGFLERYEARVHARMPALKERDVRRLEEALAALGRSCRFAKMSPQELNKALCRARSPDDVLSTVVNFGYNFDGINCATALHRLAKAGTARERVLRDERLPVLLAYVQAHLAGMDGDALAITIWSCARLGVDPDAFFDEHQEQVLFFAEGLSAQNLSNALWGYARALQRFPRLRGRLKVGPELKRQVGAKHMQLNGQELATVAWALAKLDLRPDRALLHALQAGARARAPEMSAQEVSMFVWALGRCPAAREDPATLAFLSGFEAAAVRRARDFTATGVGNVLGGWAALGHAPGPAALDALCLQLRAVELALDPGLLSAIIPAFGRFGYRPHDDVLWCLWRAVDRDVKKFRRRDLLEILDAFDDMDFQLDRDLGNYKLDEVAGGLRPEAWGGGLRLVR